MTRRTAVTVVTTVLVVLGAGGAAMWLAGQPASHAVSSAKPENWTEAQWPFPMDQWGKGKAYQCKAADCGVDMTLYIRAKIGFCNCTTGVADDEELERISDLDLVGTGTTHVGDGRPINVAWMKGRSRAYATGPGSRRSGLSIAFNDRCDAVVATAMLERGAPAAAEPVVLEFLNSQRVLRWAEAALGL